MTDIPPQAQLGQMITGYWISQSIYAAAKSGIADVLHEGAKSVDELADTTDTKPELLYRLLRASAFFPRGTTGGFHGHRLLSHFAAMWRDHNGRWH